MAHIKEFVLGHERRQSSGRGQRGKDVSVEVEAALLRPDRPCPRVHNPGPGARWPALRSAADLQVHSGMLASSVRQTDSRVGLYRTSDRLVTVIVPKCRSERLET